ncbi:MAG: chromosome segregation protein SMC [Acidobacteria bacterium]|nr:MAG: chromosome segregation protein SMC [Acidobacteriota bacterium]
MRVTRVKLRNWRNFTTVDVALPRRVFLVGPNASGKSNLLDVFRFLRDLVSVGGGLQEAVRRRSGVSSLRCLAARRYSDIVIRVDIGDDEESALWRYEVTFNQDNLRRPIIKSERVFRRGRQILDRPDRMDRKDPERLTQTYLEQVYANQKFRQVADFFASIRYLHVVPQLIREPDRSLGRANDPFGGDFLETVARTPERTRNARLRRIREALTFAVPQLRELELQRDERGTPHLRGKYEHWRPRGAWQTEEHFSDGTLRLIGLLWAMQEGPGPLLLEEPELSLHPEVVRYIPQMFARVQRRSGRQVLVSTHSPDMLRDEGIGLDEVLLLLPSEEGTSVEPASSFKQIRVLLEHGQTLADIVIPQTRPEKVDQLSLFEG